MANKPSGSSGDTNKTTGSWVLTNDIIIDNIPTKVYTESKLNKYFKNKIKSGFKRVEIVNQNTAIIRLKNEEGTYVYIYIYL